MYSLRVENYSATQSQYTKMQSSKRAKVLLHFSMGYSVNYIADLNKLTISQVEEVIRYRLKHPVLPEYIPVVRSSICVNR